MNFLKKLFGGDDDDKKPQSSSPPRPKASSYSSAQRIQQIRQASSKLDEKSIEELVEMIVASPAGLDHRDAMRAGDTKGASGIQRAWDALQELQKRTESQAIFDALIPYINTRTSNLQYQRALASVGEDIGAQALIDIANTGDRDARLNAMKALSEMKTGLAAEGLVGLIFDADKDIRSEAVRALGFSGHPKAHEALKDYDSKQYPLTSHVLNGARRWSNVPETLADFRKRKEKGDLGIDETLARLEEQYAKYWTSE